MNRKIVIVIGILLVTTLLIIFFIFSTRESDKTNSSPTQGEDITPTTDSQIPSDEEAEQVAFTFIQNFIKSAPPEPDATAEQEAYNALSQDAKNDVSEENISRDLAAFIGVQGVPDQGASVEDLQLEGDKATLFVGLNYSGGRVIGAINMIVENGEWKINSIDVLEQYPPIE